MCRVCSGSLTYVGSRPGGLWLGPEAFTAKGYRAQGGEAFAHVTIVKLENPDHDKLGSKGQRSRRKNHSNWAIYFKIARA